MNARVFLLPDEADLLPTVTQDTPAMGNEDVRQELMDRVSEILRNPNPTEVELRQAIHKCGLLIAFYFNRWESEGNFADHGEATGWLAKQNQARKALQRLLEGTGA